MLNIFKQITIDSVEFTPVENYNASQHRPYTSGVTEGIKSGFETLTRMNNFTPEAVAGIANNFVTPVAESQGDIYLANGYRQRRYAFIINARVITMHDTVIPYSFTGYTEHDDGLSLSSGNISDDMVMVINSITEYRRNQIRTPNGFEWSVVINKVDQMVPRNPQSPVITNQHQSNGNMRISNNVELIVPQNVFYKSSSIQSGIEGNNLQNFANQVGFNNQIKDGRYLLSEARMLRRENNDPTAFVSKTFQSFKTAARTCSDGDNTDWEDICNSAAGNAQASETIPASNGIIAAFRHMMPNFDDNVSIRWKTLLQIDPQLQPSARQRIKLHTDNANTTGASMCGIEFGNSMTGVDGATLSTQRLFNAIPHIITSRGFTAFSFAASNKTLDRSWCVTPAPHLCINTTQNAGRQEDLIQSVIDRIIPLVLIPISSNGLIDIELSVYASFAHDMRISISYGGANNENYVLALFDDANCSPCISFDGGMSLASIAANVHYLCNDLINGGQEVPPLFDLTNGNNGGGNWGGNTPAAPQNNWGGQEQNNNGWGNSNQPTNNVAPSNNLFV